MRIGSKLYRSLVSTAFAASVLTVGVQAFAADEEEPPAAPLPRRPVRVRATEEAPSDTDHGMVVGHFGFGYFGDVPIDNLGPALAGVTGEAATSSPPVIGFRYWVMDNIAIDAGLGFLHSSSSASTNGTSTDQPSTTAFVLRGGVPFTLATFKHATVFVEPIIAIGHLSWNANAGSPATFGNTLFEVGGKAGIELQFGFIGLPHLALDANVGLSIQLESGSYDPGTNGTSSTSYSSTNIATDGGTKPWDIFRSNINVMYYL